MDIIDSILFKYSHLTRAQLESMAEMYERGKTYKHREYPRLPDGTPDWSSPTVLVTRKKHISIKTVANEFDVSIHDTAAIIKAYGVSVVPRGRIYSKKYKADTSFFEKTGSRQAYAYGVLFSSGSIDSRTNTYGVTFLSSRLNTYRRVSKYLYADKPIYAKIDPKTNTPLKTDKKRQITIIDSRVIDQLRRAGLRSGERSFVQQPPTDEAVPYAYRIDFIRAMFEVTVIGHTNPDGQAVLRMKGSKPLMQYVYDYLLDEAPHICMTVAPITKYVNSKWHLSTNSPLDSKLLLDYLYSDKDAPQNPYLRDAMYKALEDKVHKFNTI